MQCDIIPRSDFWGNWNAQHFLTGPGELLLSEANWLLPVVALVDGAGKSDISLLFLHFENILWRIMIWKSLEEFVNFANYEKYFNQLEPAMIFICFGCKNSKKNIFPLKTVVHLLFVSICSVLVIYFCAEIIFFMLLIQKEKLEHYHAVLPFLLH